MEREERIDEGFKQLEEENNKRYREEKEQMKNLARSLNTILTPAETKATQTKKVATTTNASTQTPSLIEILPQLLEELKINITQRTNAPQ